ncbi:MAG TPA: bifunctional diguanylate cyclase/phosphodiesterase, partial [Acidimicrobiales bacterium]|nr:bifunctional diguanylate cyclase/phosphodiesterase [Acidimicrobiales bacterium]
VTSASLSTGVRTVAAPRPASGEVGACRNVGVLLWGQATPGTTRDQDERARKGALAALGTLGAVFVAYVVWTVFRARPDADSWFPDAFEVVVALLCLSRGLVRRRGRLVPVALGLGLLSWAGGDTLWTAQTAAYGAHVPSPSWADAFWLGFYPPAYVAVVLFVRQGARRVADSSWLDGVVASLGAGAACAVFVFYDVAITAGKSPLAKAAYIAYPIGDLVLFALVVGGATVLSGKWTPQWALMAGAMVVNAVGDTFNLFTASYTPDRLGTVAHDLAWPLAGLLLAIAMWLPSGPRQPAISDRTAGFTLPGLAALCSLAILSLASLLEVNQVALALASATLAVAGLRVAWSARALRSATKDRHRQSITDELTGLKNRRYLLQLLDATLSGPWGALTVPTTLLFIDLNRFKEVNDSFGHAAGDELLKQLGPRLAGTLAAQGELVRLGGDEFAAVLVGQDATAGEAVARCLLVSLAEPFAIEGVTVSVSASVGIATAPQDARDPSGLLKCADTAMFRAKFADLPCAVYDPGQDEGADRLRLSDELSQTLQAGGFQLHFQPQLDFRSGEISAVEVLLRWPHPRSGYVPPLKFLPLAEESGLMPALTAWVLDRALAQCAAWRRAGKRVTVAVNVSPSNLLDDGFIDVVHNLLDRYQLPHGAVVLEVTETSVIANFQRAKRVIDELRQIGVMVSIDDFGAGFTSLAYLRDLAVGELKLDGSFIKPLAGAGTQRDRALVRSTISLGQAMGLRVVAECIEDPGTMKLLADLGCDVGQGFFIGRPVPAEALDFGPPIAEVAPPGRAMVAVSGPN